MGSFEEILGNCTRLWLQWDIMTVMKSKLVLGICSVIMKIHHYLFHKKIIPSFFCPFPLLFTSYVYKILLILLTQPPLTWQKTVQMCIPKLLIKNLWTVKIAWVHLRCMYLWSDQWWEQLWRRVSLGFKNFLLSLLQVSKAKFNLTSVMGGANLKNPCEVPFLSTEVKLQNTTRLCMML